MACITFPIDAIGPVIEIGISQPRSLLAQGSAPPQIAWIKAIADTGCTHTSIHSSVAAGCGLAIVGKLPVSSTMQTTPVNLYHGDVFIRFPVAGTFFEWRFPDVGLLELLLPSPQFQALLGMDILNRGTMYINGAMKQATFCV